MAHLRLTSWIRKGSSSAISYMKDADAFLTLFPPVRWTWNSQGRQGEWGEQRWQDSGRCQCREGAKGTREHKVGGHHCVIGIKYQAGWGHTQMREKKSEEWALGHSCLKVNVPKGRFCYEQGREANGQEAAATGKIRSVWGELTPS